MFAAARLRLTLWYLTILAVIVLVLSIALDRVAVSLQQAELRGSGFADERGFARLVADDERTLAYQIVGVDFAVMLPAALGAYVLAGRTLRPIQDAMERQRGFAAAASHELRTPLTVLQGTLDVALLRRRTTAQYEEILRSASTEVARMSTLVVELLVVARAESDAEALNLVALDLRDVAHAAADGVRPLAESKGQTFEVSLSSPLLVRGDALKLRQAVVNLLENAVYYTPQGGRVCLSGRQDHGKVTLQVRDTGPGIAPEHLPHLDQPFYRVDDARSGSGNHAGLGLALTAWIARAHRGDFTAESRVGVGSVFTITLPGKR